MKHLTLKLACLATLSAVIPATHAAVYPNYEGVKGFTTFSASVDQWQWLQAMAADGSFDGLAPSIARGVQVVDGELGDGLWDQIVLTVSEDRAGQMTYYKYELKNVLVTSYQTSGGAQGPSFKLDSFASATMSWLPPRADGGRGEAIVGQWDRTSGRFSGDLAVLGAFDDLGAERWADGTLALTAAVPEPGTWALMLLGVAALGSRLRRQPACA
jgi:hypothetical protein